jgi:ribonuclease-3
MCMDTGSGKQLQRSDIESLLCKHVPGTHIEDLELFRRALRHRSFDAKSSYERLEFLGDAVLNLVVAAYLYRRYPGENEGFMTRMRTKLVNGAMLADLCSRGTKLGSFVLVNDAKSAPDTGGEPRGRVARNAIMEDVFEAFLGATFVDRGFEVAQKWLVSFLEANVDFAQLVAHQNNPKDVLNKYFMLQHGTLPRFEEAGSGGPTGVVCVRIRDRLGTVISTGTGANRKAAENAAARNALAYYDVATGTTA